MICRLIKIWSWISFAWSLDHSFQGSWSLDFMQKTNGSHASSDSVDLEFILIQLQNTLWSKLQMFLQMICNWQPLIIWISLAKSFMIGSNFESNYLLCSGTWTGGKTPLSGTGFHHGMGKDSREVTLQQGMHILLYLSSLRFAHQFQSNKVATLYFTVMKQNYNTFPSMFFLMKYFG